MEEAATSTSLNSSCDHSSSRSAKKLPAFSAAPTLRARIAKDISERKLLQDKLIHAESLSTVGELALTLANDLRNPLQSMQIATYWLNKDYSSHENSPEGMKMLQTLNNSISYSDNIVKQLLDFASSKTPVITLVNVNSVVTDALEQVQNPGDVELKTEFGQIPPIEANEDMLKRVFLSLAENGITAMKYGGCYKSQL